MSITKEIVEAVLRRAVDELLTHDRDLLEINAHERTVAGHLACYLKPSFPGWHIDVEYNRDWDRPKRIQAARVYPDIVIHRRLDKQGNLLVLELKIGKGRKPDRRDFKKLKGIKKEFGYQFAVFLRLYRDGVRCLEWVADSPEPGQQ